MNALHEDDFSADWLQDSSAPEPDLPQIPDALLLLWELEGELERGVCRRLEEDTRAGLRLLLDQLREHLNALFPEPESPRLPFPERVRHQAEFLRELDQFEELLEALQLLGQ